MYIQDQVRYDALTDDVLNFYRAIGVDMIHLDIRSGVSTVDSDLGQKLRNGEDFTRLFEQALEQIEAHDLRVVRGGQFEIGCADVDM